MENAQIQNFKCDILINFQTLCIAKSVHKYSFIEIYVIFTARSLFKRTRPNHED